MPVCTQLSDTLETRSGDTGEEKLARNGHSAVLAQLVGSFEDEEDNVWNQMLEFFARDARKPTLQDCLQEEDVCKVTLLCIGRPLHVKKTAQGAPGSCVVERLHLPSASVFCSCHKRRWLEMMVSLWEGKMECVFRHRRRFGQEGRIRRKDVG